MMSSSNSTIDNLLIEKDKKTDFEAHIFQILDQIKLVCDDVHATNYDMVMPIIDDETIYTSKVVRSIARGDVLDLGTGSGALAVAASGGAETIVGTDINPKAIKYAQKTAELNNVENKCTFKLGDLYEPVVNRKFDLIVMNPPFVPLPFGVKMFLSADGGFDGMQVAKWAIKGAPTHLKEDGTFILLAMSLGDEREPLVFKYLRDAFAPRQTKIESTHIYESRNIDAEPFFAIFESMPTYNTWREYLYSQNLTHLYYTLNVIEQYDNFEHIEKENSYVFEREEFSGSWEGRLNRFSTWFSRKNKTQDHSLSNTNDFTSSSLHLQTMHQ